MVLHGSSLGDILCIGQPTAVGNRAALSGHLKYRLSNTRKRSIPNFLTLSLSLSVCVYIYIYAIAIDFKDHRTYMHV